MLIKWMENSLGQSDFGYINARVRSMSAKLLTREHYQKLLEQKDVRDICAMLGETDYNEEIRDMWAELGEGAAPVAVYERALELNFNYTLDKMREILGGKARRLFDLMLEKWDVQNIKTILRFKSAGAASSLIMDNVSFPGHLTEDALRCLAQSPNVRVVVEQLDAWGVRYAEPLKAVFRKAGGFKSQIELELALDKAYYGQMLELTRKGGAGSKLINSYIRREIDNANILNGLRMVKAQLAAVEGRNFFLEGGEKIERRKFNVLVSKPSLEEALDYLKGISYKETLEKREKLYDKIKDVAVFERGLEEQLVGWLKKVYTQNVLGFGVVLGYMCFKYLELTNLRILGRCVEFGVPEEVIWGELILYG